MTQGPAAQKDTPRRADDGASHRLSEAAIATLERLAPRGMQAREVPVGRERGLEVAGALVPAGLLEQLLEAGGCRLGAAGALDHVDDLASPRPEAALPRTDRPGGPLA